MYKVWLTILFVITMTTVTVNACCDNPFPSTKPPEPTGFTVLKQSDTSAFLKWDAIPCHQDWIIIVYEAYIYQGAFYYYAGKPEVLARLAIDVIATVDDDSKVPYNSVTPRKVYQLCVYNTHTGEQTCAARWIGLYN